MHPKPPSTPAASPEVDQQATDAEFLAREFDMNPKDASELVARNGLSPDELKSRITDKDGEPNVPDPLEGVPVPTSPKKELTKDADEQARKPVVHRRNDTQGAG